jgi:prepilin-type N-terminal cleavage/methylation domain-containing protein
MKNLNKKAFTLIELLVVVLIIGILSAIALPQYRLASAKAKVNRDAASLRAVKEAFERYYMTYGKYPPSRSTIESLNELLDVQITLQDAKTTFTNFDDLYVMFKTTFSAGKEVSIAFILDKYSGGSHAFLKGNNAVCAITSKTLVEPDDLIQKVCKSICGHDNLIVVWSSGQYGCVANSPGVQSPF